MSPDNNNNNELAMRLELEAEDVKPIANMLVEYIKLSAMSRAAAQMIKNQEIVIKEQQKRILELDELVKSDPRRTISTVKNDAINSSTS